MPMIGDDYPFQVTGQWNGFDIVITVPGPKDQGGNRTVDIEWSGPSSGSIQDFVITPRLLNETQAEAALRHFGGVIQ